MTSSPRRTSNPLCLHFPRLRGLLGDEERGDGGEESRSAGGDLEQWLEYFPIGKNKLIHHLPHLQVAVWRCPAPTRLFPTRQEPNGGADPEELVVEVDRLEQKAASLDRVLDEQRDGLLCGGRRHGSQGDEGIEGERMCSAAAQCENRSKVE
uniref:Uncharacterized protein n=1 Tax=Oryza meridionalis TaxID=40149 RepID=A0A0E0D0F4_9ORYZ